MPTENVVKVFVPNAYYHVYDRDWNLGKIFNDEGNYVYFEELLARYLSTSPIEATEGRDYKHFNSRLYQNAYCLMGNNFHMLVYQYDEPAVTQFMRTLMNVYAAYFNSRHKRQGSLFESKFKSYGSTLAIQNTVAGRTVGMQTVLEYKGLG